MSINKQNKKIIIKRNFLKNRNLFPSYYYYYRKVKEIIKKYQNFPSFKIEKEIENLIFSLEREVNNLKKFVEIILKNIDKKLLRKFDLVSLQDVSLFVIDYNIFPTDIIDYCGLDGEVETENKFLKILNKLKRKDLIKKLEKIYNDFKEIYKKLEEIIK